MPLVFLSLGGNKGNRLRSMALANKHVSEMVGTVTGFSSIYETEPWGFQSDQLFLNQVILVETEIEPNALMNALLRIEAEMGRVRSDSYQSRGIDIDILLYGESIINSNQLLIPHPRMHERKFVLLPLNEIDPGIIHPVLKLSARQMLEGCTDTTEAFLRHEKKCVPEVFEIALNSKT